MELERTPRLQLELEPPPLLEPPLETGVAAVPVLVEGLVEGMLAPCGGMTTCLPRNPRVRPGVPSVRGPLMGLL